MNSVVEGLFYGTVDEDAVFPFPRFTNEQKRSGPGVHPGGFPATLKLILIPENGRGGGNSRGCPKGPGGSWAVRAIDSRRVGGMGLDSSLCARLFDEISSFDASIATFLGAPPLHRASRFDAGGDKRAKGEMASPSRQGRKNCRFLPDRAASGVDAHSIKTKATDKGMERFPSMAKNCGSPMGGWLPFTPCFARPTIVKMGK